METSLTFGFVFSLLFSSLMQCQTIESRKFEIAKTYYIRHFEGKCVEYDDARQVLVYGRLCREKFEWQGGVRLVHIPTKKCININATSDGSFLSLSSKCSDTNSLFQYDENNRVIRHLFTNKCLHPETGNADPAINTAIVLKSGCDGKTNKFYFRKKAYYIIRHFGGLCWVYTSGENLIKLRDLLACDRFEYVNNYHLRHVETGKCVIFSSSYLRLTDDCESPETVHKLNQFSLLQNGPTDCIHPLNGALYPANGNLLTLESNGCTDEDRLRFFFHDDKDTQKIKIISESCLDATCASSRGYVIVNGRQYSLNTRGINVVLFDYRSGLLEYRKTYDVYGVPSSRDLLATFLNNLPSGKLLLMAAKTAVNMNSNLALALQKVGVSATFATTPVPRIYMSLAYVGYTGQVRKDWEKTVNKIGGSGASIIEVSIKTFHERDGIDDCSNELGVRTRKIPDFRFYAKTVWGNDIYHQPYLARLHYYGPGWCSYSNTPVSEYLQVDLGTMMILSGVAIQSHGSGNGHAVTKFKIEYSENGIIWQFYKSEQDSVLEFTALRERNRLETSVNWFGNLKTRLIRVVPTDRLSVSGVSCMRIELYGCAISRGFLSVDWSPSSSFSTNDNFKGSVFAFGTIKNNLTIGISTASSNKSLANKLDLFHFDKINASTTFDNGTVKKESGVENFVTDKMRKIDSVAFLQFNVVEENYYVFDLDIAGKVLDAKLTTGEKQAVISTDSQDRILVFSSPLLIKRLQPDKSILQLNITKQNSQSLTDDSFFNLNLSVSHLLGKSNSNAYGVTLMIYFNSKFLQLKSLAFVNTSRFSLPPSRNTTTPGFIMIQTDTLWLINRQEISIILQAKYPKTISRGENCNEDIIIDFAYMNNLAKFDGTVNSTLERNVPFKCKIDQTKDIRVKSARLPSPEFSMVYDDVNQQLFFCYQRKTYMTKNSSICFSREKNNTFWKTIPYISAVTGMDVEKRVLYGLERAGKSYVKSPYPFALYSQIEDTEWTSAKDQPQMRASLNCLSLSLLPQSSSDPYIFKVDGKPVFAATTKGILWRKEDLSWKRIVFWK
ncbi:uncharacterized protein LOC135694014 [Rhopilema esculentum]|uniref:uncharacterized protein LOC135694014 n=1 Tax=Rhopilema esculentum TaxID=499914 RepID=UPI0031E2C3C7